MKKRLLAILLSVAMITSMFPIVALAADDTSTLVSAAVQAVTDQTDKGNAFKAEMEAFRAKMKKELKDPGELALANLPDNSGIASLPQWDGSGAIAGTDYTVGTDGTVHILTATGLAWMSEQISAGNLAGALVMLDNDIDLSGKLWTPADFTGSFDGQGHTITGLTVSRSQEKYLGLFRSIVGTAENRSFVRNLNFHNVSVYALKYRGADNYDVWPYFGTVAGYSDFTDYSDITLTGTLTFGGNVTAAGIVLDATYDYSRGCKITNCDLVDVEVYSPGDFYGIAEYICNNAEISGCDISGSFVVDGDFCGIAYEAEYGSRIVDCTVTGTAYVGDYLYGIVYDMDYNELDEGDGNGRNLISGCTVELTAYVSDDIIGIVGHVYGNSTITDCAVSGSFYAAGDIYGIMEDMDADMGDGETCVLQNCSVSGEFCAEEYLRGLCDEVDENSSVDNCTVSGTFYGDDFCGLGYELDYGSSATNCTVSGKAYSNDGCGAFGYVYSYRNSSGYSKCAVIDNVNVDLTAYYDQGDAGGLVIETYGDVRISNCTVAGTIYSCYDVAFGGIVSYADNYSYSERVYANGSHRNGYDDKYCDTTDHARDSSSYHNGRYYTYPKTYYGNLTVENCKVTAPIWRGDIADSANGGIVGNAEVNNLSVSDCTFTGGLYLASGDIDYAGGLIGDCSYCDESVKVVGSNVICDILYYANDVIGSIGGLIGSDATYNIDSFLMDNCNFNGNIIVKSSAGSLDMERVGGLAANVTGDNSIIKNCSVTGQIILDASEAGVSGSISHGGALLGGWKYPDFGQMEDCSFAGDVTILGNADNLFNVDHFGMIVGENCAKTTVMNNVTIDGDFYSDYADNFLYFGGAVGHRCCDVKMTGTNVTVNTDITLLHSGNIETVAGFIGDSGSDPLTLTNCEYNGDITIEMIPPESGGAYHTAETISGFLGCNIKDTDITYSSHTGSISVSNAAVEKLGGFYGDFGYGDGNIHATDSYTYGDITVQDGELSTSTCIGQWVSYASVTDMYTKNCFSVGDITVNVTNAPEGSYIGAAYGHAATDGFTMDNFYYAGTVSVTYESGNPTVGYISGTIDGPSPSLTNVYYDKELYAASQCNGNPIPFEGGQYNDIYLSRFVPLSTAQMQANRYEADDSFRDLDGSPAVEDPTWDYVNGSDYAEEVAYKTPLVDALNAGKDGYLNWVVTDEFRGYPHFGQSWTILYYVDFGNGYELQNIEQFTQKGITAQEIPTPDQTIYPNSAYEWQDQNGVTFTEKTRLFGDKMVYADLVSYYTVQYITNYPDDLAITPTDNDILENGYISGATVTVRSNNTFTVPAGYQFKEWNTEADGSGESVAAFSTQQITNENLVFYAIWEPLPQPTYSVYYVANGGNGDMWDATEYEAGDTVTVMQNEFVHPDGFIFDGFLEYESETLYSADDDDTANDTFEIQRDTYLIAQWKAPVPTYSVTYLANGGDGTMTDDTAYEAGDEAPIKANTFTMEGYEFAGFVDLDNNHYDGDGTESITITKDTVLIAQWTPVKYSVTYHGNGAAEQDVVDSDYIYGTTVTVRDGEFTFTKEGSRFLYWSLTADGEKAYDAYDTFEITENVELYAIWEEVQPGQTYSITYKGNGAIEQDYIDDGYAEGANVTIKSGSLFTREGYKFLYWSLSEDGDKEYDPYDRFQITEDVVLYAIWEEVQPGQTYSITYKGNGAIEQDFVDDGYAEGSTAIIKNGSLFTRSGYTFQYWSLTSDGEQAYSPYDRVVMTGNITLYAIWKQDTTSGGGGGGGNPSSSGTVNIIKTDSVDQDTYLAGAKFKIYTSAGKLIGTYTTNEDGQITVSDLDSGRYYAIESTPPTGYTLDTSKHEFAISSGKTTVLSITNERTGVPPMLNGEDHFAYVVGRNDGLVHPEANITRAEVATIFFRLLDPEVRAANLTKVNTFADVNEGMWCNTAISTMAKLGIVNGRSADTFDPNAFITRAEFAAIAARFDSSSVSELANFTDINGHWARWEISKAAANGWVNGYSDGTFKPNQNITRAEAMALINRVLNRDPETPDDLLSYMVTWPDNMDTSKWYYLDVQEATNSHDYKRKNNGCETWIRLTEVPDWTSYER